MSEETVQTAEQIYRNELVEKVASKAHALWQEGWRKDHGNEPREKDTTDQKWIDEKHTNKVDLNKTDYKNLPEDWQLENKMGATSALEAILDKKITDFEKASTYVHEKWIERNGEKDYTIKDKELYSTELNRCKTYEELSETQKEKDRLFVRLALETIKK